MMKIEISSMKGGKCPHCGMGLEEKESPAHEAMSSDAKEDMAEMKAPPKKKKFKSMEEVKAFTKKKYG